MSTQQSNSRTPEVPVSSQPWALCVWNVRHGLSPGELSRNPNGKLLFASVTFVPLRHPRIYLVILVVTVTLS